MTKSLICLQQVIKKYRIGLVESTVLNNISLTVNKGEMIAIVGASGSGKSTLMNIIGLLDIVDSGTYHLQGQNVADFNDDALAMLRNKSIGFVFQQFNLLPRFTAEQNIALPLTYRNMAAQPLKKRVNEVMARVGITTFAAHRPMELSGGQQQRVAIARALVGDPQVILADEPTGSLDSSTGKDIMALFSALHHEGRTIILVTHDEQVARLCQRRITLVDGHIAEDLT